MRCGRCMRRRAAANITWAALRVNYFYVPLDEADEKAHMEELKKYGIASEDSLVITSKGNFYPLLRQKIIKSWDRIFTIQPDDPSLMTALALKGETIDEITASAAGMRAHCIKLLHDMDVLEIVGTGGDGSNSFNISTTASLVIAAGGVPVAKHGNRAASSKSGAADVLEALGVKITIPPEKSQELLEKIGICFLFAQNYHIAMKYVAPIRKELGIRTVFNILGPLSNPAGANMELMGVYDEALVEPLAQVMANLGVIRGMVVFGQDSLDEISMSAPTSVCEIKDGKFTSYVLTPEQF